MCHRSFHGCQSLDIQKSSSSSDGEPGSEVVMRMLQSKSAMMENPPCELVQQQSQRYSHQSDGEVERMVQTIRNQVKTYKIQIDKNSGATIKVDSASAQLVITTRSMAIHAIPQTTRLNHHSFREDPTHVLPQPNLILWRGSCVKTTRSIGQKMESAWLEGVWIGRDSNIDEHLLGTQSGMVRSRVLKRRVERRRWDTTLLNAMVWDAMKPTPVTRRRPVIVNPL